MNFKKIILLSFILFATCFYSCDLLNIDLDENETEYFIPKEVTIELPTVLSSPDLNKSNKILSASLSYNKIRNYIYLADEACQIVSTAYNRLLVLEIRGIYEFSFTAIDGKTKLVSIKENFYENGRTWDYFMEIFNESFSEPALKAYWNKNPLEQVITFVPSKLNILEMTDHQNAIVKIEYKKDELSAPYEKSVFIGIDGLQTSDNRLLDPDNLMLFVGKSGNILDIIGGVNNPNATIINTSLPKGRNWTFTGKADMEQNIAVMKFALPPCNLADNQNLMTNYSAKNVFVSELRILYPEYNYLTDDELLQTEGIDPDILDLPVYFNETGFLETGPLSPEGYSYLLDFNYLTPFIPNDVKEYMLE